MSACYASFAERGDALVIGACALEQVYPRQSLVRVVVVIGPNRLAAIAVFHWPGIVRVTFQHDGALVAESVAGHPKLLNKLAAYPRRYAAGGLDAGPRGAAGDAWPRAA